MSGAVHVVDDDEAVRQGITLLLRSAGFEVTTHASGLAFLEALPGLTGGPVGCVLTDVRMPGLDGIALLRRLRDSGFDRPVIVMTAHGDIATAVQAMKAGAADFVEKPFDDDALLELIETALAVVQVAHSNPPNHNQAALHPDVIDAARRMAELSVREREVLERLIAGKSNKVVAHELGISQRTAEVHRARMLSRLGVRTLAEAVRLAIKAELAGGSPGARAEGE
jgi:two-component system response regulator FixJ